MPAASTDLRAAGPWAAMAAKVFGTRSGQIYAQIKKAIGSRLLSDSRFGTERRDTLSKHDQEVITPVISGAAECDYCVAAHNYLAELAGVKPDALKQIRVGQPTGDVKRDALVRFVRKLAQSSGTGSDEDFAAIRAAGYSDAQLVEINLAFATNVFNRINDAEIDFPAVA